MSIRCCLGFHAWLVGYWVCERCGKEKEYITPANLIRHIQKHGKDSVRSVGGPPRPRPAPPERNSHGQLIPSAEWLKANKPPPPPSPPRKL